MSLEFVSVLEAKSIIGKSKPKLILVTGKTCTGKSTFARSIGGYEHLELDYVVRKSVVDKFSLANGGDAFGVYKGNANIAWQKSFEEAAHNLIADKCLSSNIVVDAAIANAEVIERIFFGDLASFLFVYFHPSDLDSYCQNIAKRLVDDIENNKRTFPIWDYISTEVLSEYRETGINGSKFIDIVRDYGDQSMKTSVSRLESFSLKYKDILVVGS